MLELIFHARQKNIQTHIHTRQLRTINARESGGNPSRQGENMQTPHIGLFDLQRTGLALVHEPSPEHFDQKKFGLEEPDARRIQTAAGVY